MSSIRRTALVLALALGTSLAAAPAFAGEARDAFDQALKLKEATKKGDEAARGTAQQELQTFAKAKVEALSAQKASLSKLELGYLGQLQVMAGDKEGGIATLRGAIDKKDDAFKYGSTLHSYLVQTLIETDQPDGAANEAEKMLTLYPESKEIKVILGNLGMTYRAKLQHEKAAVWLGKAFEIGNTKMAKPWISSLLLAGKKDDAVAAAKTAVEKGIPQEKEDMQVVANVTEKHGTDVSSMLKFDSWLPGGSGPEMNDKVVAFVFTHMSARTFKFSLRLVDNLKKRLGDDGVAFLATTYYGKDFESGKMDASVTPEKERSDATKILEQADDWRGWVGYLKDEAAAKEWGVSGVPHLVIVGRDGKLLYATTFDFSEGGTREWNVAGQVIDRACGR